MREILLITFLMLLFLIMGCTSENGNSSTSPKGNSPPRIVSVTASPSSVHSGYPSATTLNCIAIDPDGDSLHYNWSRRVGNFRDSYVRGQSAIWSSSSQMRDTLVFIQVTVSDGRSFATDSVSVYVL